MLGAIILVCSAHVAVCDADHFVSKTVTPVAEAMPAICFLHGQAYVAESAIRPGPDEFVKVICIRRDK